MGTPVHVLHLAIATAPPLLDLLVVQLLLGARAPFTFLQLRYHVGCRTTTHNRLVRPYCGWPLRMFSAHGAYAVIVLVKGP
jgi:hypothetical protein